MHFLRPEVEESGSYFIYHTFPGVKVPSLEFMALLLTSLLHWANYLKSLCLSFFIHKIGVIIYLIRLLWRLNKFIRCVKASGTEKAVDKY